jgi:hypothetical protein
MDHILSTTASDPLRGVVKLVCIATDPGLVDKLGTAWDLRRAIAGEFTGPRGGRRHPGPASGAEHRSGVFRQLEPPWRTRFETTRPFISS